MQNIINFIMENKLAIVSALLALSEILSFIPAVKANGIFQLIFNGLKKAYEALKPAQQ